MQANFPRVDFLRTALKFGARNSSSLVYVLHKTFNEAISRRSRLTDGKEMYKLSLMHVESYCFCLKKPIVFLTYPFSLPSPSPSLSSLLKLESNCILSSKILNSPKFLTILCCSFIYFITTSFSGKVTIQEFRKLPTAAMDDYMNRLKETSPIHRDRTSNQAWIHQGSLAGDVMKRLRRR